MAKHLGYEDLPAREFETMSLPNKLMILLVWHPARCLRVEGYKVSKHLNEINVICPCVWDTLNRSHAALLCNVNVPVPEIPPLEPLPLKLYSVYKYHVFIGECPKCKKIAYLPVGALSTLDGERIAHEKGERSPGEV